MCFFIILGQTVHLTCPTGKQLMKFADMGQIEGIWLCSSFTGDKDKMKRDEQVYLLCFHICSFNRPLSPACLVTLQPLSRFDAEHDLTSFTHSTFTLNTHYPTATDLLICFIYSFVCLFLTSSYCFFCSLFFFFTRTMCPPPPPQTESGSPKLRGVQKC